MFGALQNTMRVLRMGKSGNSSASQTPPYYDESRPLVALRLAAYLWVNSAKLSVLMQAFTSSFLHFPQKSNAQNTLAVVLPILITRWLEQNSGVWTQLHTARRKLDSSADTLFEMTGSMADGPTRRALMMPLQFSLIILNFEVFEVASQMREANTLSLAKKAAFLSGLQKSLRSPKCSPIAVSCHLRLLRLARLFRSDSDAALLSYALDVEDDIREEVFRKTGQGLHSTTFDASLLTAAFVSLAQLHFDLCLKTLVPVCLDAGAPLNFKIAIAKGCTYLASRPDMDDYQALYSQTSKLVRSTLKAVLVDKNGTRDDEALGSPSHEISPDLLYSVLELLKVRSTMLFMEAPSRPDELHKFFDEHSTSLVACVASNDERTRQMASSVAQALLEEDNVIDLQQSWKTGISLFHTYFWKATYVCILQGFGFGLQFLIVPSSS